MSSKHKQKAVKPKVVEKSKESEELEKLMVQQKLERELVWCIQKLERGLSTPESNSDPKKVQEATKILKILRNPNAPLVKKRQAMRSAFGDYRKKMQQEHKKHMAAMKKMKLMATDKDLHKKSMFFRKSSQQTNVNEETSENTDKDKLLFLSGTATDSSVTIDKNFVFKNSEENTDNKFNFAFNVDESEAQLERMSLEDEDNTSAQNVRESNVLDSNEHCAVRKDGQYFKVLPSSNEFRFNFEVS